MQENKIRAKKSLGQNFLKSKKALRQMVEAGSVTAQDTVIEIGPGTGALTDMLLETGATVIAFEKDNRLISLLTEKYDLYIQNKKFKLIEQDILEADISKYVDVDTSYKLVANIPYYITGEIIKIFLTREHKPICVILLVQKEVAKRIVDTKESILSLSVKVFGKPKYVATVAKEFFSPKPKVDSAILAITEIHPPFSEILREEKFFRLIKKAFGQKRKKISSTLGEYKNEIACWEEIKDKRPEHIGVEEWIRIIS